MSHALPTGYRKRPWELTFLAIFFALVPVLSWIAQYLAFVFAGRSESIVDVILGNFATTGNGWIGLAHSILVAGLWILFFVVAWGIFRVEKWGFRLTIVSAVGNSVLSTVIYSVSTTPTGIEEHLGFNPFQIGFLLNLVFFVPVIVLLRRTIMAPFFNPRLKWWEQHQRVKALLKIDATIAGQSRSYQSFDISASGMFLGTGELPEVAVGGTFPATIRLEELNTVVEVLCKAVWISDGKGRAPVGCGVTFEYLQKKQKKSLDAYIKARVREGHALERT